MSHAVSKLGTSLYELSLEMVIFVGEVKVEILPLYLMIPCLSCALQIFFFPIGPPHVVIYVYFTISK